MWWLIRRLEGKYYEDAYTAGGWGGQFITVFPTQKIVVVHKTKVSTLTLWGITKGGTSNDTYWAILDRVIGAKTDK